MIQTAMQTGSVFLGAALASLVGSLTLLWTVDTLVLREVIREGRHSGRTRTGFAFTGQRGMLFAAGIGLLIFSVSLSVGITGRPIFGLVALVFLPFLIRFGFRLARYKRSVAFERSAISFLHTLLGLTRVGVSLPAALFQVSRTQTSGTFAQTMGFFLARFEEGRSLKFCLDRFREHAGSPMMGTFLCLLEMVYRNGLPVAPLLETLVPLMESENQGRERMNSVKIAAATQVAVAFLIPWILALTLFFFQPELLERFTASTAWAPLLGVILAWEGLGGWFLWKISSFD